MRTLLLASLVLLQLVHKTVGVNVIVKSCLDSRAASNSIRFFLRFRYSRTSASPFYYLSYPVTFIGLWHTVFNAPSIPLGTSFSITAGSDDAICIQELSIDGARVVEGLPLWLSSSCGGAAAGTPCYNYYEWRTTFPRRSFPITLSFQTCSPTWSSSYDEFLVEFPQADFLLSVPFYPSRGSSQGLTLYLSTPSVNYFTITAEGNDGWCLNTVTVNGRDVSNPIPLRGVVLDNPCDAAIFYDYRECAGSFTFYFNGATVPSLLPVQQPTPFPTKQPVQIPTVLPTRSPSRVPTGQPIARPTILPTATPTFAPCPNAFTNITIMQEETTLATVSSGDLVSVSWSARSCTSNWVRLSFCKDNPRNEVQRCVAIGNITGSTSYFTNRPGYFNQVEELFLISTKNVDTNSIVEGLYVLVIVDASVKEYEGSSSPLFYAPAPTFIPTSAPSSDASDRPTSVPTTSAKGNKNSEMELNSDSEISNSVIAIVSVIVVLVVASASFCGYRYFFWTNKVIPTASVHVIDPPLAEIYAIDYSINEVQEVDWGSYATEEL